jgi:hypothetical protein
VQPPYATRQRALFGFGIRIARPDPVIFVGVQVSASDVTFALIGIAGAFMGSRAPVHGDRLFWLMATTISDP